MASWNHEGIIELFRSDPRLAAKLLQGPLGVALPAFSDARIESGTMADLKPAQAHADLVVVLRDGSRPVLGVVVEVQRKEDPDKLFSWPAYVAWLRRALRTEACVLVITQDERVATWASRRIVLGPGGALQPLVLRPNSVPVVDTVADARNAPELAVLSAMVHGAGHVKTAVEVALAASTAAHDLDRDRFLLYFGLIRAALSEAARKCSRCIPTAHGSSMSRSRNLTSGGVPLKKLPTFLMCSMLAASAFPPSIGSKSSGARTSRRSSSGCAGPSRWRPPMSCSVEPCTPAPAEVMACRDATG